MTDAQKQGYYELVEPRTLFNSVIPVLLGIMYSWYNYHFLRISVTVEMAIATIVLQIFMNVNDGFWDYFREDKKQNSIGKYGLSVKSVRGLVITLFLISAICAVLIGIQTNIFVWIIGIICYLIAIFYSSGKHTISAGPCGEFAASFAMGLGIFLVMVYINEINSIELSWKFLGQIILAASIPEACNFTLMLGNNLRDYDADIANGRHTLVSYIGIKNGLILYASVIALGILLTIWAILIRILPWSVLAILVALPLLVKNIRTLFKNHRAFKCVVQNTQSLFILEAIGFLIGIIFNW